MCSIMRRVRHSEAMKRLLSFGAATAAFSLWAASCSFVTDFRGLGSATATGAGGGDGPVTSQTTSNSSSQSVGGSGGTSAGGIGGSGGEEQPCPPPGIDYGPLKINEVHARGIPDDWIELKNTGSTAIPLCAVFITQSYNGVSPPTGDDRYTFNEVTLGAGGYLVVTTGVLPTDLPFGLDKDIGERVTLWAPDASILDDTTYPAPPEWQVTESWGREPDGTGSFVKSCSPTKNAENVFTPCATGAGGGGGN